MIPLTNSKDCETYLRNIWEYDTINYEERVYIVFLNNRGVRIDYKVIYDETSDRCRITLEHVFKIRKKAKKLKSKHIVLAHNHPSGSTEPSEFDLNITNWLIESLKEFDITILDHIILTEDSYFSFKDQGLLAGMKATG